MNTAIFVYSKDNIIKVLDITNAHVSNDDLINDGWTHTHTLDACAFLEYMHNKCKAEDIISEILSLSKINK